jgi:hypothetical protein
MCTKCVTLLVHYFRLLKTWQYEIKLASGHLELSFVCKQKCGLRSYLKYLSRDVLEPNGDNTLLKSNFGLN